MEMYTEVIDMTETNDLLEQILDQVTLTNDIVAGFCFIFGIIAGLIFLGMLFDGLP